MGFGRGSWVQVAEASMLVTAALHARPAGGQGCRYVQEILMGLYSWAWRERTGSSSRGQIFATIETDFDV